jgi:hypothetical protein
LRAARHANFLNLPGGTGGDGLGTRTPFWGLVCRAPPSYNANGSELRGGISLQLDDHLKQLLRELGHAINDTVSESERIVAAIAGVRASGYDIVLKLDATIGLARRPPSEVGQPDRITSNDRTFLEALHIQVDQEVFEDEDHESKFEITPQDLRFLKSLKISLDESL